MEEENRKKNKYFDIPEIRILTEKLFAKNAFTKSLLLQVIDFD